MKLQLESYGKKYTIETEYDDIPLEDYFDMFSRLLVQAGFHQSSIEQFIVELADEFKDIS
jgi:hypothetical protein